MNMFRKFTITKSGLQQELCGQEGWHGCTSRIALLREAEGKARQQLKEGIPVAEERAMQAYINLVACARTELERMLPWLEASLKRPDSSETRA